MGQNKKIILVLGTLLTGFLFAFQANSATVQRSSFIVSNLSCTSCLATIEAELKSMQGTLGMDADLASGRVTVDHLATLHYKQIAATISKLGYPATVDWTATLSDKYTRKFSRQDSFSSGCSTGGCGVSGGSRPGLTIWRSAPATGTISRTTLRVSNLSCSACLNNIADELRSMPETYGMRGYLSRGVVIVDHSDTCDNSKIAAAITNLGYPARILALNEVPAQKAFSANTDTDSPRELLRSGFICSGKNPCNATAASWQQLYQRYFSQKNSK